MALKTSLVLRIGLAFVFAYAATAALLNPDNWIGYFPRFLQDLVPANNLLPTHSTLEIILAVWILSGFKRLYSGILAALALGGILIFNFNQLDVVFRDVGLAMMALGYALSKD